jgi:hypothetical protein
MTPEKIALARITFSSLTHLAIKFRGRVGCFCDAFLLHAPGVDSDPQMPMIRSISISGNLSVHSSTGRYCWRILNQHRPTLTEVVLANEGIHPPAGIFPVNIRRLLPLGFVMPNTRLRRLAIV